jgi:hypothetical protein
MSAKKKKKRAPALERHSHDADETCTEICSARLAEKARLAKKGVTPPAKLAVDGAHAARARKVQEVAWLLSTKDALAERVRRAQKRLGLDTVATFHGGLWDQFTAHVGDSKTKNPLHVRVRAHVRHGESSPAGRAPDEVRYVVEVDSTGSGLTEREVMALLGVLGRSRR